MSGGLAHFLFEVNGRRYEIASAFGWVSVLDSALGAYYTSVGAVAGKWVRHVGEPTRLGTVGLFEVYKVKTTRNDDVTVRVRQIGGTSGGDRNGIRVGRGRRRGR